MPTATGTCGSIRRRTSPRTRAWCWTIAWPWRTSSRIFATPAARTEAAHYITGQEPNGFCYDCHTLDPDEGEPATSFINSNSRTLPWMKIFNGRDMEGWSAQGGRARIENGALVSQDGADLYFKAKWREFALDCEVIFTGERGEISLAQSGFGRGSSQVLLKFHEDGDVHVNTRGRLLWKSGIGRFPPGRWMRLGLHLTRRTLRVERDGDVAATVDLSRVDVEEGGLAFWSAGAGSVIRMRNIRVRALEGEVGRPPAPGGTGLTRGLVGWWKFDDAAGTTARDSSGNGNHGEAL